MWTAKQKFRGSLRRIEGVRREKRLLKYVGKSKEETEKDKRIAKALSKR
jgi:hypothetical protein